MVKQICIHLQNFKCYSLWSKLPVISKGSKIFAVNDDMKILHFWELLQVGAFVEKKTDEIKICDCTSSTFPFSPWKV